MLEQLAVDSDTILGPLARERRHVSGFIENSAAVARATAERGDALQADIELLPEFLPELSPRWPGWRAQRRDDAGADRPRRGRARHQPHDPELGPFSPAAGPAFESLGEAADRGTPGGDGGAPGDHATCDSSRPPEAGQAEPPRAPRSLAETGGINRPMDYFFYQVAAINGFDSFGHYLRAALIVNPCTNYAVKPVLGCSATSARPRHVGRGVRRRVG